jgi:hypothetical protein
MGVLRTKLGAYLLRCSVDLTYYGAALTRTMFELTPNVA